MSSTGSAYNDIMIDNTEDNLLVGGGGNDTIVVTEGYDVLKGGPGNDDYDLTDTSTSSSRQMMALLYKMCLKLMRVCCTHSRLTPTIKAYISL